MAQTTVQKLKVSRLGKYGFFAEGVDRGFNYSMKFSETDKSKIVPGVELEAEVYVSDAGAQYLNKAKVLMATPVKAELPKPDVSKPDVERAKKFTPTFKKDGDGKTDTMSKEEWASKDKRISRQGLWQAAVQALAPVVSLEMLAKEAEKLADEGLKYVNR